MNKGFAAFLKYFVLFILIGYLYFSFSGLFSEKDIKTFFFEMIPMLFVIIFLCLVIIVLQKCEDTYTIVKKSMLENIRIKNLGVVKCGRGRYTNYQCCYEIIGTYMDENNNKIFATDKIYNKLDVKLDKYIEMNKITSLPIGISKNNCIHIFNVSQLIDAALREEVLCMSNREIFDKICNNLSIKPIKVIICCFVISLFWGLMLEKYIKEYGLIFFLIPIMFFSMYIGILLLFYYFKCIKLKTVF